MKRISILLAAFSLFTVPVLRAQDAATEERLNKLAGRIDDLVAGQEAIGKRIEALGREVENLRSSMDKPAGNYAGQEDLKRLAEAVKEIDRKRLEDYDKIRAELLKFQKNLTTSTPSVRKAPSPGPTDNTAGDKPAVPDKVFEYIVKKGDTLSIIVQAYRDNNIKVSTEQILKANPGLKPEKLRVGQKIFIPVPQS